MYLIFMITLLFTTPAFAQDVSPDTINKRILQLEAEKTKLEEIYKEITVRIDELKQLIAPKQSEEKIVPEKTDAK